MVIKQGNFLNSFANHLLIEIKNFCTYDIESTLLPKTIYVSSLNGIGEILEFQVKIVC